ncbi:MAG TPA: hypothetical protein VMF65_18385 [Acidimicrobiales bacterium]|nr:hypothetical protein [Acidimicrobiales bacterium]
MLNPADLSVRSTASARLGKNGVIMSGTTRPMLDVEPRLRARATGSGRYPSSSAASATRLAISGRTGRDPLSALDTDATDNPAARATSRTVTFDWAIGPRDSSLPLIGS